MHGVQPLAVLTDSDPAVITAVPVVFCMAVHILCFWHILHNLFKNLRGKLGGQFSAFVRDFISVQRTCGAVACERRWQLLLLKYPDATPYMLKQFGGDNFRRWASPWTSSVFSAGSEATGRIEGLNKDLTRNLPKRASLAQVYEHITAVQVKKLRNNQHTDMLSGVSVVSCVHINERVFSVIDTLLHASLTGKGFELCTVEMGLIADYVVVQPLQPSALPLDDDFCAEDVTLTAACDFGLDLSADATDKELVSFVSATEAALEDNDRFRRSSVGGFLKDRCIINDFIVVPVRHSHRPVRHYVVLYNPVAASIDGDSRVYREFFCTCMHHTTMGVPCRHFFAVLKNSPMAGFHLGMIHKLWLKPGSDDQDRTGYELYHPNGKIAFAGVYMPEEPVNLMAHVLDKSTGLYVPRDKHVARRADRLYGQLWGLSRELVGGLTKDLGEVQEDLCSETLAYLTGMLAKLKLRRETGVVRQELVATHGMAAATDENMGMLVALSQVRNPAQGRPDGSRQPAKAPRKCGLCKGTGHNSATCPKKHHLDAGSTQQQ
jgi:hypothetical protein